MADFDQFWAAYPRRIAKKDARKAWDQINPSPALVDQMLAALEWQVRSAQWREGGGKYVPYPGSWLRGERWDDERPQASEYVCPHNPKCQDGRWRCHQRVEMARLRAAEAS